MNDFGYVESTSNFTAPTDSWEAEFDDHVARKSTMSGEMDLIAYWKSQPETPLRIVALQILNVPASSAPVERIFSMCGNPHKQTWPQTSWQHWSEQSTTCEMTFVRVYYHT